MFLSFPSHLALIEPWHGAIPHGSKPNAITQGRNGRMDDWMDERTSFHPPRKEEQRKEKHNETFCLQEHHRITAKSSFFFHSSVFVSPSRNHPHHPPHQKKRFRFKNGFLFHPSFPWLLPGASFL